MEPLDNEAMNCLRYCLVISTPIDEHTPEVCRKANGKAVTSLYKIPHSTTASDWPCRCIIVKERK